MQPICDGRFLTNGQLSRDVGKMKQDIQFITDVIVPEATSFTLDSYLTKPEIIPWEDVEKNASW